MDFTAFSNLISEIGFPIACVIALFVNNTNIQKQQREDNKSFREIIESNTLAITKLTDLICTKFQLVGKDDAN